MSEQVSICPSYIDDDPGYNYCIVNVVGQRELSAKSHDLRLLRSVSRVGIFEQ